MFPYAFPALHTIDGNWNKEPSPEMRGMSLRDYFAAQVITGVVAAGPFREDVTYDDVAAHAYKYADAMLRAREPQP